MTRDNPRIRVTCDDCRDWLNIDLTGLARGVDPAHFIDAELEEIGWGKPDNDDTWDLCSQCMDNFRKERDGAGEQQS